MRLLIRCVQTVEFNVLCKLKPPSITETPIAAKAKQRAPWRVFEHAQQQGSPAFQKRPDQSLPHRIVSTEKRGACKLCCSICPKGTEKHKHTREGCLVKTKCEDCDVHLCTSRIRFPGAAGCEESTCFMLFHSHEHFPSFCDQSEEQMKLLPHITKNRLKKGRKAERKKSSTNIAVHKPSEAKSSSRMLLQPSHLLQYAS